MKSLHLDMPLAVTPGMVSPTRRLLETRLAQALDDEDAVYRVAMTAHELLENAAKYASDGRARLRLEVTPTPDPTPAATGAASVRVTLINSTSPEHIDQLRTSLAEMRASSDALGHYFAVMRRNAKLGSISRLGLARLRAEGEMEIDIDIAGDVVTIVASTVIHAASATHSPAP